MSVAVMASGSSPPPAMSATSIDWLLQADIAIRVTMPVSPARRRVRFLRRGDLSSMAHEFPIADAAPMDGKPDVRHRSAMGNETNPEYAELETLLNDVNRELPHPRASL